MHARRPGVSLWQADAAAARELKTGAALHAAAQVLRARRPLAGGERDFLRLYRGVSAAPAPVYSALLADPAAYWYAHLAFDLTGAVLGTLPLTDHAQAYLAAIGAPTPAKGLRAHLDRFGRFALGAAVLARRALTFPSPLSVDLPAAVPGTALCLDGAGRCTVTAVSAAGALVLDGTTVLALRPGASAAHVRVVAAPVARAGRLRVALNPVALDLPGAGFGTGAGTFALDAHAALQPTVERALALACRHLPGFAALARDYLRVLAIKPLGGGGFTNVTHSELPGACLLGWVDQPWELADTLIHELHHNRLFALDEFGPWFEDEDGSLGGGRFYSPWRDDLRPLAGLLHAVYVHVPVHAWWLRVWQAADTPADVRELAADRVRRYAAQLRIGLAQLAAHARFAPPGRVLYTGLRRRVAGMDARAARAGVPAEPPAREVVADRIVPAVRPDGAPGECTVRDVLRGHLRALAPADQFPALAALIG